MIFFGSVKQKPKILLCLHATGLHDSDSLCICILFEFSVSQPFFASHMFLNRTHYAVLLGGIISRVEPILANC